LHAINIEIKEKEIPPLALNLLKQEKTAKCGIKIKQHKAGWDKKYLQKILEI